jgi:predicted TIM-barrel fold metal-dependent hydrolase
MDVPRIVSVDDHVLEPGDLWLRYLPQRFQDRAPRLQRMRGRYGETPTSPWVEDAGGPWADVWVFGDVRMAIAPGFACAGKDQDYLGQHYEAMLYDDMRPGCYDRTARLADMDVNHVDAGLSFPTFPRFCGQTFAENPDRELGLACVEAYNNWMIDEFCADEAYGRLIPLTLVPLWDPQLAAAEVRRCAAKGAHAIAFSENPVPLGLPSIHTDHWDPLFTACEETEAVINLHIGSSSTFPITSPDAPRAAAIALGFQGAMHAFADWLTSGVLERYKALRMALSEGEIGWIPFLLQRLDAIWLERPYYGNLDGRLTAAPSTYLPGRVWGCVANDAFGLTLRDQIGMDQIMFEVDYPHGDSTWPHTKKLLEDIVLQAGLSEAETYKLARGNAIECYGLKRFGINA